MVTTAPVPPGERPIRIAEEMRTSYLTYAMSVIVARALPDVRDGLKPGTAPDPVCHARHGHTARLAIPQERPYRWRGCWASSTPTVKVRSMTPWSGWRRNSPCAIH